MSKSFRLQLLQNRHGIGNTDLELVIKNIHESVDIHDYQFVRITQEEDDKQPVYISLYKHNMEDMMVASQLEIYNKDMEIHRLEELVKFYQKIDYLVD